MTEQVCDTGQNLFVNNLSYVHYVHNERAQWSGTLKKLIQGNVCPFPLQKRDLYRIILSAGGGGGRT